MISTQTVWWRRTAAAAVALAMCILGTVTLTPTAAAETVGGESATTTDATLTWGVRTSLVNYITGPIADGTIEKLGDVTGDEKGPFGWAGGSGTATDGGSTADIDFGNADGVHFQGHAMEGGYALDLKFMHPRFVITSATEGELHFDVVGREFVNTTEVCPEYTMTDVTLATLDLTGAVTVSDGMLTITDAPAALTEAGFTAFGEFYPAGTQLDPVTLTASYTPAVVATETTTTLTVSPETITAGDSVTLTANIDPLEAAGTVEFQLDGKKLGTSSVSAGSATYEATGIAPGSHAVSAAFTPDDAAQYEASNSGNKTLTVNGVVVSASPAAPVTLGETTTITATITPNDAAGTVQFYDTPATGTSEREIDIPVAVADGTASLEVSDLSAGGHTFRAEFIPTGPPDNPISSVPTANYGVVDTEQALYCTPSGETATVNGIQASWAWSQYSNAVSHTGDSGYAWSKVATGKISTDSERNFVLTDGVAQIGDDCTSIAFTGTMRVNAYESFFPPAGQWVELVNPTLAINADGNGAWIAGIRSGVATLNTETSDPTVIASISDATLPDFTTTDSASATIALDYDDTTADGTWATKDTTAYTAAWSNAFVITVPSAIRSFYYASGAGGDGDKPPAPISVSKSADDNDPGPGPDDDDETPGAVSTTVSVTQPSAAKQQLTVRVAGSNYVAANLPKPIKADGSEGSLAGVYTAVRDAKTQSFEQISAANDALAVDWVMPARIKDGSFTSELSVPISKLYKGGDYEVLVWSAHGVLNNATLIFQKKLTVDTSMIDNDESDGPETPAVTIPEGESAAVQGKPITFSGAGFAPGESVTATVYSDPVVVGTLKADANGTVTFTWTIPADFPTGQHRVVLAGDSGTTAELSFTVASAVLDPDQTPTTTVITPQVQCEMETVPGQSGSAQLSWGVKSSFVSYIEGGIAKGTITTSNGAVRSGGAFTWGTGSGSLNSSGVGTVSFPGSVHFTGHGGVLDLKISNLQVKVTGSSTGQLIGTVKSQDMDGNALPGGTVTIGTLKFGAVSENGGTASVTLTSAGATAFAGFYESGEVVDPLTLTVKPATAATTKEVCRDADGNIVNADGTPVSGGTSTSSGDSDILSYTGVDVAALLTTFAVLTMLGAALIIIGRRRELTVRS